jgi:hypothetical protein
LVSLGRRQDDARRAARLQVRQGRVEEQPPDATAAMLWVNDEVVQDARRPAERQVIVPLDRGVRVADHVRMGLGDEDGRVRLFEFCTQEGRIVRWSPVVRGQEAPRVKVVMRLDQERAGPAEPRQVAPHRTPNEGHGGGVSGHRVYRIG